ncbi:putative uncharacterized protein [Prevotella sp. CAG:755]|nr:putative uncharacterized protein [Prevotella sp. CAG:755]
MKKIIGLDLGTTSIGWAYVHEAESAQERSEIVRLGARVVPLTTDEQDEFKKGKSITTNAARLSKRSLRRNADRFQLRRDELAGVMKEAGWIDETTVLAEQGPRSTFETLRLRAKAASEEVTLAEFARILLQINRKRGYKSNRKTDGDEEGALIDGMDVSKQLNASGQTPGEWVLARMQEGNAVIPAFYCSDLSEELDRIWRKQQASHQAWMTEELHTVLRHADGRSAIRLMDKAGVVPDSVNVKERRRVMYEWRAAAVRDCLPAGRVAAALMQVSKEIGRADSYLGRIGDRSKELYFHRQTVGQYLWRLICDNPNQSLKNLVFYRQDYQHEFETLWSIQTKYHVELTEDLRKRVGRIIFFQRPLKSKKGLVNRCELVHYSVCENSGDDLTEKVDVGPKVCPKSSPLFQEFKVWQVLNNVEVIHPSTQEARRLEMEEKELLASELLFRDRMKKIDVLKLLFSNWRDLDLNYKELEGNRTMAAFYRVYEQVIAQTGHGDYDFAKMRAAKVKELAEGVFAGLGFEVGLLTFDAELDSPAYEQQPCYRLWHLLYSYEGDKSATGNKCLLKKLCRLTGMNAELVGLFMQIRFSGDYGSLSTKAMRRILPYLKAGNTYDVACEYAGFRHSARSLTREELAQKEYKDYLDLLPRNSLRNPVVEKILNQMIHVVNGLSSTYGKPDEIRVEMARELKKSAREREEMTSAISKTTKENAEITAILQRDFGLRYVSRNDILRYKLYCELRIKGNGCRTLYSNTYINPNELFSREFDIEHIIPQSRLFDDSFSNKTLESRTANLEKGDRTAWDYVNEKYGAERADEYRAQVEALYRDGTISKAKRDKLLMPGDKIPEDFIDRDIRNTQYIAKKALEIFEDFVPSVVATSGNVTARLREDWGLVDVMKELNWSKYESQGMVHIEYDRDGRPIRRIVDWTKRNDHRHHAMDALAVAFTKRSYIQYLNHLNARKEATSVAYAIQHKEMELDGSNRWRFKCPFGDRSAFRREAKAQLERILVSIKSKNKVLTPSVNRTKKRGGFNKKVEWTPRGALHNETVYGRIRRYDVKELRVGSSFTAEVIGKVADSRYRAALMHRLAEFGGDPKKAFTGKNSLEKNPLYTDEAHTACVPSSVKVVSFVEIGTIRKGVDPNLNVDKVVDTHIKNILLARLSAYGGDAKKAFSNLDADPIWLNKEKGIAIKRVTISDDSEVRPIHVKRDMRGRLVCDEHGRPVPSDYVQLRNNHHVAIFRDANGELKERVVTFFEAVERVRQLRSEGRAVEVIDKNYKCEEGWTFLFSMKINEYFVFPDAASGFDPREIDLTDPANYALISPHLFRVQKLSSKDYYFRHHLETTVNDVKQLRDITWKRISSLQDLAGTVKVRVNHIGQIVAVGEY